MKIFRPVTSGLLLLVCLFLVGDFRAVERTTRDSIDKSTAPAAPSGYRSEMPDTWFVEMSSPPLAEANPTNEAKYLTKLKQEKADFRTQARREGLRLVEHYAYDVLWNGLSVEVDPTQLLELAQTPGVAALYPVFTVELPEPAVPVGLDSGASTDLFTAITMTGADQVQREGITGRGVKVAVIDTGIDYTHPDLGGGFGPGFKVEGGFDLVGDAYIGPGTIPFPDANPIDCNGHGTHVSGIIAASGYVTGVAPGATLRAYKIFGCEGSSGADVILAAMEMVLQDGNQVVNLSLGNPFQWPEYPTGRGADNLVNKGVVVVASAGNSGEAGLFSMGTPGNARKSIGVASVENLKVHCHAAQLPGGPPVGYLPLGNADHPPLSGSAQIKDIGHGCNTERSLFVGLDGKIAVAQRGRCPLGEMVLNARNNRAAALLIYNNVPGIFIGSVGAQIAFPVATISMEDGLNLAARARFFTTLFWTNQFVETPNMGGGTISFFSSYGPGPDLDLKPDVAAPGGLIFSTLPLLKGGYGLASGTSMSSPHVAGTVALLLEARPHTSSQAVRDLLQNTSVPRPLAGAPASLELVQHQGAGMVDIHAAIAAQSQVHPGKLALGEMEGQSVTRQLTVQNDGDVDLTYQPANLPAPSTRPIVFDVQLGPGAAAAAFSPSLLHVPAGQSAALDVTFTEPADADEGSVFGGYVVLSPVGGGRELRVPYLGMKGDYQKMVALYPEFSPFGNPLLISDDAVGPSVPITINPGRFEFAPIIFALQYSVRRLKLELFDARSGRAYGRLFEASYFPRNSAPGFFDSFFWSGRDADNALVPAGDYTLKLSVEKALGDDANPAHWEVWSSPAITVVY